MVVENKTLHFNNFQLLCNAKSMFVVLTGFSKKNPETPPTIGGYGSNGFRTALNFPENCNISLNRIGII